MSKAPPGRSRPKKASHPPPGDLITLGGAEKPKTGAGGGAGSKKAAPSSTAAPVGLSGPSAAKRPRTGNIPFTPTPLGRPSPFSDAAGSRGGSSVVTTTSQIDNLAIDIEPAEFLASVQDAEKSADDELLEGLLCGAVKHLRAHRAKPDQVLVLSLMYLAKKRSHIFSESRETTFQAFCSLLKRDAAINFKAKGNPTVPVLVCNMFGAAYANENVWPEQFVRLYIEDSLGERMWADHEDCKFFVDGILTAFGTKMPSRSLLSSLDPLGAKGGGADAAGGGSRHASPAPQSSQADADTDETAETRHSRESTPGGERSGIVAPRYDPLLDELQENVVTIVREQLNKRGQPMDSGSRNLLKFLISVSGIGEVRSLALQKLEIWLQNPKLGRVAQDLLMAICVNSRHHSRHDIEVMSALTKMRVKSKPLITHFTTAIKELLAQHPENLRTLLKHTIFNELSAARNPNNMVIIAAIFQHSGEAAAETLAEIFQDLLLKDADYLRNLRGLLREIVRTLRHDLAFIFFCRGLMADKSEAETFIDADHALRLRFVHSVADLVTLASLLGITPAVREAAAEMAKVASQRHLELKPRWSDVEPLRAYQNQIAVIHRDSVWWLHTIVPKMIDLEKKDLVHLLHKLLFLESHEHYCNKDNWPPENDRTFMIRLASDVPLLDDTLMRVLVLGHSSSAPSSSNGPNPNEAIDLADRLVRRAAALGVALMDVDAEGQPDSSATTSVLKMERLSLFDTILNLCSYQHPETSHLPKGYTPPVLAISNLYWKAWNILLIISAFNTDTFGDAAWNQYQMLRCLMEMVMTSQFNFPPPTFGLESQTAEGGNVQDQIRSRELQLSQLEKQEILVYEGYLAKNDITETNSLLLSQLITLDPKGIARRPPQPVLHDLQQTTQSLKLGQLLCRSRQPDFLLDIIQRQGTSQSMPWLADLVESSEGSLDVLPIQCLCEFLLHDVSTDMSSPGTRADSKQSSKNIKKLKKQAQLLQRLQSLLRNRESSPLTVEEVMEYFLKRLSSPQAHQRVLAIKGLTMILEPSAKGEAEDEEDMDVDGEGLPPSAALRNLPFLEPLMEPHGWLLKNLPTLPLFHAILPQVCKALRKACQIETDPRAISAYLIFIGEHAYRDQDMNDLVLDLSQFLVERSTLVAHVLPPMSSPSSASVSNALRISRHVLRHLLSIMVDFVRKSREVDKDDDSSRWSNDQVEVRWSSGETARLHITVIHAMIILLTFGSPGTDAAARDEAFHDLLEIWFPDNGRLPRAFLVDTREEALLIYDWIKLRMLRSEVDRLVEVALMDLEASQLVIFVQSFGIPVKCMSRLLRSLDKECRGNPDALEIQDKIYLIQLIRIQHRRGAVDGKEFLTFLTDSLTPEESAQLSRASGGDDLEEGEVDDDEMTETETPTKASATVPYFETFPSTPSTKKEIFKLMNSLLNSSSNADLRTLLHLLVSDPKSKPISAAGVVVDFFKNALDKDQDGQLWSKLASKATWPMAVFSTLGKAAQKNSSLTSSLAEVARRLMRLHESLDQKDPPHPPILAVLKRCARLTESSHSDSSVPSVKSFGQKISSVSSVSEKAFSILKLLSAEEDDDDDKGRRHPGVLVDWLELLDSEVVGLETEKQTDLILEISNPGKRGKAQEGGLVPYLLGLLVHQSNWETLGRTITHVLSSPKLRSPTLVLDLLHATLHSPKLWQGRDRKVPKNHEEEDVLALSRSQIHRVVELIVEEVKALTKKSEETETALKLIEKRLTLLHSCCAGEWGRLQEAALTLQVEPVAGSREKPDEPPWLRPQLLLQFYFKNPQISSVVPHTKKVLEKLNMVDMGAEDKEEDEANRGDVAKGKHERTKALMNSFSQLDITTHLLLTTMASAEIGAKGAKTLEESCGALRQIAAAHPLLILRQLPLLATHLRGRSNFTLRELITRHHLKFMASAIGVLELVQPLVFDAEFAPTLKSCLDAVLEVFETHLISEDRQLAALAGKTVTFCHRFIQHAPEQAKSSTGLLLVNQTTFQALNHQKADMPHLASLMSMITAASQAAPSDDVATETTKREVGDVEPDVKFSLPQLAPFLRRIARGVSDEDALDVLEDLNETSKKRHEILEFFIDDLHRLILESASESCRSLAHALLLRYLQEHPDSSSSCVTTFLRCLESDNADVVESALKHVPDYALACQTRAAEILGATFDVGVTTKKDTSSVIGETLKTLSAIKSSV